MPTYCFICDSCQPPKTQEVFEHIAKKPEAPACECGQVMDRDWGSEHSGYSHKTVFPYVTTHLTGDGKPVEVRDAGHLRDLCKKYGKVQRDDASYVSEEAYTNEKGRWTLKDAGRGLPQRWF